LYRILSGFFYIIPGKSAKILSFFSHPPMSIFYHAVTKKPVFPWLQPEKNVNVITFSKKSIPKLSHFEHFWRTNKRSKKVESKKK